jgi:hypothetical protein
MVACRKCPSRPSTSPRDRVASHRPWRMRNPSASRSRHNGFWKEKRNLCPYSNRSDILSRFERRASCSEARREADVPPSDNGVALGRSQRCQAGVRPGRSAARTARYGLSPTDRFGTEAGLGAAGAGTIRSSALTRHPRRDRADTTGPHQGRKPRNRPARQIRPVATRRLARCRGRRLRAFRNHRRGRGYR